MLKILLIFFKCIYWNQFVLISFHERQLKALEQFEAKVYSSFQKVAHV